MAEGVEGSGAAVEERELAKGGLVDDAGWAEGEGEGVCGEVWGCGDGVKGVLGGDELG